MDKNFRVNEQIRISPLRVVDASGTMLGIISREEALAAARGVELDLVEVAPSERPPVCRIMDYGKFKYEQKKKSAKQRHHSHQVQMKEVRMRPKIGENDLSVKIRKARDFLEHRNKVLFVVQFKGRENAHQEQGRLVLDSALEQLQDVAKIEKPPGMEGRRMTMILGPATAK